MSFDAVHDLQAAFRGLLEAVSFPGRAVDLSEQTQAIAPLLAHPEGVGALGLAAAALIDQETSYFVADGPLASFLVEWSAVRPVGPEEAAFVALGSFEDAVLTDLIERARLGTLSDPHLGATVLIGVDDLDVGTSCRLSGPGIETTTERPFPAGRWLEARGRKVAEFPLGVDLLWFDRRHRVVALPRTTVLKVGRSMAYVAVKGGERAIEASLSLLKAERLENGGQPGALIDQVMAEASLYAEDVAALAVAQAEGSPEEAVFLLRAFRSTVPRLHTTRTIDTADLWVLRRISAAFKDIPGGQLLGATPDYSHRLIDFEPETDEQAAAWLAEFRRALGNSSHPSDGRYPKVVDYLRGLDLLPKHEDDDTVPGDVTKKSLEFPASRSERLQILARGQTGAVTALGYASLRGYGALHPTVGELRVGRLPLTVADPWEPEGEDNDHFVGEIRVTEVETLVPVEIPRGEGRTELEFDLGYGLCYGRNETKAVAMSLLDQVLTASAGHEKDYGPLGDEEFVLLHVDSVEATGFISHLKLPHYVTFQSKLESVRETRLRGQPQEPV